MKNEMIILIVCIVGYFLVMMLAKNVYSSMLAKAMMKQDEVKARKLLFSNLAIFLLNHQMLSLMRASFCCSEENYEEAMRYCNMIKTNKLSLEQRMSYYAVKVQIALGKKDIQLAQAVQKELIEFNEIEKNAEIEEVIEDNEIQIGLLLSFDVSIIEKLNKKLKTCDNEEEKSLLYINLAKAYYKNHQSTEAINALKQAKKCTKNPVTLKVIEHGLKDVTILD